jgi:membrane associated rhomboid family serine protease
MPSDNNQKPLLGADNNALVALLAINLVAYVMLGLIKTIYYLESLPLEQFYTQIFQPFTLSKNWLMHPWSVFTYNWVHDGFWILFGNMIWLTAFSNTLQNRGANKHIFPIYFYGALAGALVYLTLGGNEAWAGAGVSVTALVVANMILHPKEKLLFNLAGGIPLWLLGLVYLLVQSYFLLDASLAVVLATLAGGLMGALYVLLLNKGKDLGKWMHQLVHLLNNSLAPKSEW